MPPMTWTSRHGRLALVVLILLAAGALRTVALTNAPPGLYLDEAVVGYDAFSLWHTGRDHHGQFLPIVLRAFNDYRGALFSYLLAPVVGLAGLSVFTVRLASSYLGILIVAAAYRSTYELCRDAGSTRRATAAALAAAALLAFAPWHVHFSRMAIETNTAALSATIVVLAFARWRRTEHSNMLALAAFCAGLGLYAYAVMKLMMPLLVSCLVVANARMLWAHRRSAARAVFVGICVAMPMIVRTATHPEQMEDHFRQITILQPGRPGGEVLGEAFRNLLANVNPRYLFLRGSPDQVLHPQSGGQLPASFAPLILLGVVGAASTGVDRRLNGEAIVAGWLLAALVPALLTVHPSGVGNPQRTLPAVVPWCILAGIGCARLGEWRAISVRRAAMRAIAVAVGIEAVGFYLYYFLEYPQQAAAAFHTGMDGLIAEIGQVQGDYDVVFYTPFTNDLPYVHVLFFSRYDPDALQRDLPVIHPTMPDRVIRLGKFNFLEESADLWRSCLPGLYVLPGGAVDPIGADLRETVNRPYGLPSFDILGREALPIAPWHWIAQCTDPVVPLTGHLLDQVVRLNGARRITFDCTHGWIYPAGAESGIYVVYAGTFRDKGPDATWLDSYVELSNPIWRMTSRAWQIQPFSVYRDAAGPPTDAHAPRVGAPADSSPKLLSDLGTANVQLDGGLEFVDAALRRSSESSTRIEFSTVWRVTAPITRALSLMAHIVTPDGAMLGTADALAVPPLELRTGDVFVQRHALGIAAGAQPTDYWLRTGAYWLDTSERWAVAGGPRVPLPSDAVFVRLERASQEH